MKPPVVPGQVITFDYPKSNHLNCRNVHYQRRTICVSDIRDVAARGLAPITFRKRPMLDRGRWLITGLCLDCLAERSFYWEAMRQHRSETWFTLGLFDPLIESDLPLHTHGCYAPTPRDRQHLARILDRFSELSEADPDSAAILAVLPLIESANELETAIA